MVEFTELTTEGQREFLRNDIRNLETQLFGRQIDADKHGAIVKAIERGDFQQWDSRLVAQRLEQAKNEQQTAQTDVKRLELSLEVSKAMLAALDEPSPAVSEGE